MDGRAAGDRPAPTVVRELQDAPPSILGIWFSGEEPLADEPLDDLGADREGQIELTAQVGHPVGPPEPDLPERAELGREKPRGAAGASQEGRVAGQAASQRLDQQLLRIPAAAVGLKALSRHRMGQGSKANEFFSGRLFGRAGDPFR
jgi:hypothetical protein